MPTEPSSEPASPPSSILVLGCHRSGTSAVARALNLMGLALPGRLMGAGRGNTLGHWEPAVISRFNERLLETLERSWFDPKPLPGGWREMLDGQRAEAAALWQSERRPGLTTVFKDPRFSRLAEFWRAVLPDAPLVAVVCRNPHDVAASLSQRDGFDSRHGFLLWESYMLEAEKATRGLRRILVHYDALLVNPRATLEELANFAGSDGVNDAAVSAIDAGQSHHREPLDRFFENPKVPEPVKEAYRALLAPKALDDIIRFDSLRAEWTERWRRASVGEGPSSEALRRPETYFNRSIRAVARGDFENALADARKAAKLEPSSPAFQIQLGRVLVAGGAVDQGIKAFRKAARLDPRDSQPSYHIMTALRAAGNVAEALAEARRSVLLFPLQAHILLLAANAMVDGGAPDEAVVAIAQAMGLPGPTPESWLLLAAALRAKGQFAAAAGHAREALRHGDARGNGALRLQAAWLLYKCAEPAAAEAQFRDLLADPAHAAAAHAALASLLQRGGRLDEARAAAQEALRLDPDRKDADSILQALS